MSQIQNIENVDGCVSLYSPHSLYLKPLAKLSISVGLPANKTFKTISNLMLMDKLSEELRPDRFFVIKVSKSTINYIRFEAELDDQKRLRVAISRLDGLAISITGFQEPFRVRCCEAKDEVPTRHDWDSYFRDARNMDEMKSGERPDTIHLSSLPIRWFCPRHTENDDRPKPSESIFKRIFEKFGSVRCVDIPICDPFRKHMSDAISGCRTHSIDHETLFEGYVQFNEYSSFVRAMDQFRGMKLVRKFGNDKNQAINIAVTFDKTKHLSDVQIGKRERLRKRFIEKADAEEEALKKAKLLEEEKLKYEREKLDEIKHAELEKQRQREEKRKEKHLKKIQDRGIEEISQKIRNEERKLMIAQRKLESIRILEEVFRRITVNQKNNESRNRNGIKYDADDMRDRLVEKYKDATEKLMLSQKKIVEEVKSKTPLIGLFKSKSDKKTVLSSDDSDEDADKQKRSILPPDLRPANIALPGLTNPSDVASEWLKSMSMLSYGMPGAFPGLAAMYRPSYLHMNSGSYRGYMPPRIRGRGGRWRGRGRGGFESHFHYGKYDNERYDAEEGEPRSNSYKPSYSSRDRHSRSRSYSRSRSRSKGYSRRRTDTRSRSRSHYRKSSHKSRSRNRSRSYNKVKENRNRKLVSTRRSYSSQSSSSSHSRARRRSRSHHPKRSSTETNRHSNHHPNSRSRTPSQRRSHSRSLKPVKLATDELVRSAEEIKTAIEKQTQNCMREEELEIKRTFNSKRFVGKHDSNDETPNSANLEQNI